ncbi:SEC-C domain-containing protein, partial [Methanobrevibacter sp. OttesenSCG-928-I08]|nr:SEC-C domain-containing protein [Methanobrevibacter sp. OttesenSCG-928-I08]
IISHVKKLQAMFPYKIFLSPGMIINKSKCNICGKTYTFQKNCNHKIGEIYNGELCTRIIEDIECVEISLVENPVQKYSVAFIKDKTYNYGIIKYVISNLISPFHAWNYTLSKKLQPHSRFKNISHDEKCPCESGKIYKNCCLNKKGVLRPHYQIYYSVEPKNEFLEDLFFE